MASASGVMNVNSVKENLCESCLKLTKYMCIDCGCSICVSCSKFEENEDAPGWTAGKAVAYCKFCAADRSSSSAEEPKSPTPPSSRKR